MKLRKGWETISSNQWSYKDHRQTVIRCNCYGRTIYEVHYYDNSELRADPRHGWRFKRFDTRDEAFDFAEEMYYEHGINADFWKQYKETMNSFGA